MPIIKCMFCEKKTTNHFIGVQVKINSKIVTVCKSPVFYCSDFNETFLALETQEVIKYIRKLGLESKKILFNFDDIYKEI